MMLHSPADGRKRRGIESGKSISVCPSPGKKFSSWGERNFRHVGKHFATFLWGGRFLHMPWGHFATFFCLYSVRGAFFVLMGGGGGLFGLSTPPLQKFGLRPYSGHYILSANKLFYCVYNIIIYITIQIYYYY